MFVDEYRLPEGLPLERLAAFLLWPTGLDYDHPICRALQAKLDRAFLNGRFKQCRRGLAHEEFWGLKNGPILTKESVFEHVVAENIPYHRNWTEEVEAAKVRLARKQGGAAATGATEPSANAERAVATQAVPIIQVPAPAQTKPRKTKRDPEKVVAFYKRCTEEEGLQHKDAAARVYARFFISERTLLTYRNSCSNLPQLR